MPTTTINRVESLRKNLDLTQKVMARALGVTERTIIDLEHGRELSDSIGRRVTELERLHRQLSKIVRPASIGKWLITPNKAFDGDVPADLIASGKMDLLWQMIFELRSGVSS